MHEIEATFGRMTEDRRQVLMFPGRSPLSNCSLQVKEYIVCYSLDYREVFFTAAGCSVNALSGPAVVFWVWRVR